MKENGKRFIQTHVQQDGLANRAYVLIDRETGVNYLLAGFLASSGVLWCQLHGHDRAS